MSDDLVNRLRNTPNWMREGFQDWKDNVRTYDRAPFEAADRIEELEAKLAKVEAERDHWETVAIARQAKQQAAEAALPAVYRLALADAAEECESWEYCYEASQMAQDIRAQPTPTAAGLMARIQTGEKE